MFFVITLISDSEHVLDVKSAIFFFLL